MMSKFKLSVSDQGGAVHLVCQGPGQRQIIRVDRPAIDALINDPEVHAKYDGAVAKAEAEAAQLKILAEERRAKYEELLKKEGRQYERPHTYGVNVKEEKVTK